MKITERLNVEHAVFLQQLSYLDELLEEDAPLAAAASAARTIAFALRIHCQIEDRALWTQLPPGLLDDPSLQEVETEHARVEELVEQIASRAVDRSALRTFADTLRAHIESEIHVLTRIADAELPLKSLLVSADWQGDHRQGGRRRRVVIQ